MRLTDEDRAMRDGREGEAVAAAMDLLIRYGEGLGAERLCSVRNVAGTSTQPTPAKEKIAAEGGWNKA
jgi:predicted aconitase